MDRLSKIISITLLIITIIPILGTLYFLYSILEGEDTVYLSFFILGILYFFTNYFILFIWLLMLIYKKLYFKNRVFQYLCIIIFYLMIILVPLIFLDHEI